MVDDRAPLRRALEELGAEILPGRGLDFLDPWGNHIQVVEYRSIQFTKAPEVLAAMGLDHLQKTEGRCTSCRKRHPSASEERMST